MKWPKAHSPSPAPATDVESNWAISKDHEIEFWRHWIATGGDRWPDEFAERMNPETPLQPCIVEYLDPTSDSVKILDAGAGPLTYLGKVWPGHQVEVLAVDALADSYDTLLAEHGIEPPVRTLACETERLSDRFPANHFDLCYVRNALDHGYNPIRGIRQLLEVVKPGCCAVLEHFVNEGEKAEYHDLHQWNISVEEGDMIIWNPNVRHSVREETQDIGEIVSAKNSDLPGEQHGYCTVVIRRNT